MREIKFRGKRLDNGVWVEGSLLQDDYGVCMIVEFVDHHEQWHEVDPDTVGQYTGMKDKNGEEICEGDIVEWENMMGTKMCSVIAYRGRGFCFVDAHNKPEEIWCYVFKKIGNIHDNPEMLKGGE
ncbi:YopX family protein [Alistipes communis]|uniref:YopX family protein n=2 Tax=Alistipes communis TaxID=2585118 RepID=UPI002481604C|nr:YopX family protein [Alistipes communis]